MSKRDVELVVAAAATLAPIDEQEHRWAHLSLCVLDAVFSIGARYTTTCRTVRDYAAHAGLSHVLEPASQVAAGMFARAEEPVSALRERIERTSGRSTSLVPWCTTGSAPPPEAAC